MLSNINKDEKKYIPRFGELHLGQIYIHFNIWLTNRCFIGNRPIEANKILEDPLLKQLFLVFANVIRALTPKEIAIFTHSEIQFLSHPSLIYDYTSDYTMDKYIKLMKEDETGEVTKYGNKFTTFVRSKGQHLNISASRRSGKTFYTQILDYGMGLRSSVGLGSESAYITVQEDALIRAQDEAENHFKRFSNAWGVPEHEVSRVMSKKEFTHPNGFKNVGSYFGYTAGGTGKNYNYVIIDEGVKATATQLKTVMDSYNPTLIMTKGYYIFISSPDEDLYKISTLRDIYYDYHNFYSITIPIYWNTSTKPSLNKRGYEFNITPSNIISTITLNDDLYNNITQFAIFSGQPLPKDNQRIFTEDHFYRISKEQYNNFSDLENSYKGLITPNSILSKEEKRIVIEEFNQKMIGGYPDKIIRSIITVDLSKTGRGDYAVFVHVGFSITGDYYILNIFRRQLRAEDCYLHFVDFLFKAITSPYGHTLTHYYVEINTISVDTYYNNFVSHAHERLLYLEESMCLADNPSQKESLKNKIEIIKNKLSKTVMGTINAVGGGKFSFSSPPESFDPNNLSADARAKFNNLIGAHCLDNLQISGSKGTRSEQAVSSLSLSPIGSYNKYTQVVFYCMYDQMLPESIVDECYREITNFIDDSKNTRKNKSDDFVDALSYAINILSKVNRGNATVKKLFNNLGDTKGSTTMYNVNPNNNLVKKNNISRISSTGVLSGKRKK